MEDFDLASLAAYLHQMPAQIARLAERGKLPGRRVGGEWVFSRPEIHHWLEDRIGVSDDEELAGIETNLERADKTGVEVTLGELLPLEAIAIPLQARTRRKVITAMCNLAADTGMLWDPEKMAEAVTARENLQSTALDIGVALLHPRRPQASILSQAVVSLGITAAGIPFGGSHGQLTDVFFLLGSTSDQEHLRLLARLSRVISDPDLLAELRAADDPQKARRLITDRDLQLSE
ncbi:PTS sugar transporter subunit IIA [Adhaeretor mobilis]|uniref:PTS system fructose-specific EIIABC component n=1 Tax=Adhaeretor mobilis TaxID=1930276 RepID=A0A517MUS7_9BACT|nr:PTS sugar transporter subunit IIA [Adhaeretor mobilis]QDS98619.1 PTS system fructose-specific EIIABC component [Adhaeretor mobilis]